MQKYLSYIIGFWCICLMSCEKEVKNIKITQTSPKLVVTAFISPQDTLIRVSVLKSAPIFGKTQFSGENITDATVILSDSNSSITLEYNPSPDMRERLYSAKATDFPIVAGRTYFLKVTSSEGLQAEASCTVPLTQNTTLEINKVDSVENNREKYYVLQLKWQDTPGEVNYYRYSAEIKTKSTYSYTSTGPSYIYYEQANFGQNPTILSDNRLDGTIFTSSPFNYGYVRNNDRNDYYVVYGYLLNTDEHYYRYHQSLRQSNNDNPFSEPAPVYSNITDGLGVFAAYNQTVVTW